MQRMSGVGDVWRARKREYRVSVVGSCNADVEGPASVHAAHMGAYVNTLQQRVKLNMQLREQFNASFHLSVLTWSVLHICGRCHSRGVHDLKMLQFYSVWSWRCQDTHLVFGLAT